MAAVIPEVPDLIATVFANAGTVTAPPQTDPNGFVNFHDGYGPDYEIDLDSGNPLAKGVERPIQNYLFQQMTATIQFWQQLGLSPWYSTNSAGYNSGALVGRVSATSGEWVVWRSLVDANVVDPNLSGQTSWDYLPTNSDLESLIPMQAGGKGQKLVPGGVTTELILAATDFNTLAIGTYEYGTDAVATGSANTPSNFAGMAECKLWTVSSTTYGVQRYLDHSGALWIRGMQNGMWTAWTSFSVTSAAIISALGYTPANAALVLTAGTGLTGGGNLTTNRTFALASIPQSTVFANPTAGTAVGVGCALANGIILNSPANTIGLGTITPANVASVGYVNGTTATFTTSLSVPQVTATGVSANPATGVNSFAYIANGAVGGGIGFIDGTANCGVWTTATAFLIGFGTSGGALTPQYTFTNTGGLTITGALTTTGVAASGQVGGSILYASNAGGGTPTAQGSYISWNKLLSSLSGEMDFINNHGSGSGGWVWADTSGSGGTLTPAMSLTAAGVLTSVSSLFAGNGFLNSSLANAVLSANNAGATGSILFRPIGPSSTVAQCTIGPTGNVNASGTIQPGSDKRVKRNFKKIENALSTVRKVFIGQTYNRIDQKDKLESGFPAQSVERHLPHLVTKNKGMMNGIRNFRTLGYDNIVPYLSNAITELHDIVINQQKTIVKQQKIIDKNDAVMRDLMKRVKKLEGRH